LGIIEGFSILGGRGRGGRQILCTAGKTSPKEWILGIFPKK
jgi:hypothetical protein